MMWTTRAARPRIAPAVRSRVSTSPSWRAITHLLTSSRMWFSWEWEREKRWQWMKVGNKKWKRPKDSVVERHNYCLINRFSWKSNSFLSLSVDILLSLFLQETCWLWIKFNTCCFFWTPSHPRPKKKNISSAFWWFFSSSLYFASNAVISYFLLTK